ncbi:hypothetical protein DFJ73DRAFT_857274 [Zopfochytrium polystomum]|nr:hypothetical protein DFJ73DRAFT_857274 [Zopfochytrium polystomum]
MGLTGQEAAAATAVAVPSLQLQLPSPQAASGGTLPALVPNSTSATSTNLESVAAHRKGDGPSWTVADAVRLEKMSSYSRSNGLGVLLPSLDLPPATAAPTAHNSRTPRDPQSDVSLAQLTANASTTPLQLSTASLPLKPVSSSGSSNLGTPSSTQITEPKPKSRRRWASNATSNSSAESLRGLPNQPLPAKPEDQPEPVVHSHTDVSSSIQPLAQDTPQPPIVADSSLGRPAQRFPSMPEMSHTRTNAQLPPILAEAAIYRSGSGTKSVPMSPMRATPAQKYNPHYGVEVGTLSRVVSGVDAEGREVVVGTPVKEGHANYMLMYDMLTGIRVSVSRCNARENRPLDESDFAAAHKLAFDVTGNELTPSARYDFKFKDYSPWVFRHIRELFHVDANEYLMSLTGKYVLSELGSPGKSGSFFYFSQDYRFIIKTIHKSEHKFVRKVLKKYYEHVKSNPETLLTRVFGLHRVKLPGNKKIHFVVMGNVLPANKDVHETYDLKGSTVGRIVPPNEAEDNPRVTLKDLNWLEKNRKLHLGPIKRSLLLDQIRKDVEFLERLEIMDYSLLIGCHDLVTGNNRNIRDNTLAVFEPNLENINMGTRQNSQSHKRSISAASTTPTTPTFGSSHGSPSVPIAENATPQSPSRATSPRLTRSTSFPSHSAAHLQHPLAEEDRAATMRRLLAEADPIWLGPSQSRLPSSSPPERTNFMFYREMGGFLATDEEDNVLGTELYFVGIIDIFTRYDGVKKAEHFWKSLFNDGKKISAVNPVQYGKRFFEFISAGISNTPSNRRERQR